MLQEFCDAKLHQLLDSAFTSSEALPDWMREGKPTQVALLCVALNLDAAQRALPIAENDFHSSIVDLSHATSSASYLKSAHLGQENANNVLKTLRYVYASVRKGLMLTNAQPDLSRDISPILQAFSRNLFSWMAFWMSHKIYDPSHIKSFVSKVNSLKSSYPDIFNVVYLNAPTSEVIALAELFYRSDLGTSTREHDCESVMKRSRGGTIDRRFNPLKACSHKDSDSLSQISHKHHFGFHLPHIHVGIPIIVPSVSHVLTALDVRNAHWLMHINVPLLLPHPPPPSLTNRHTIDEIFGRAEVALHFIASWTIHKSQSPTNIDILKKLGHEQVNYIKVVASSIDAAQSLEIVAGKAHKLVSRLSEGQGEVDYEGEMEKIVHDLEEAEKCNKEFRRVREAVMDMHRFCKEECLKLLGVMGERIFELERSRDVLDLFVSTIDLCVEWWTKVIMNLNDFKDIKKHKTIVLTIPGAVPLTLGEWDKFRTSFFRYVEKMSELKSRFPILFQEARGHVDLGVPN